MPQKLYLTVTYALPVKFRRDGDEWACEVPTFALIANGTTQTAAARTMRRYFRQFIERGLEGRGRLVKK